MSLLLRETRTPGDMREQAADFRFTFYAHCAASAAARFDGQVFGVLHFRGEDSAATLAHEWRRQTHPTTAPKIRPAPYVTAAAAAPMTTCRRPENTCDLPLKNEVNMPST
jgi:hypothetical protein